MTSHALADTITFGLDTFGDVTLDAAGLPLSHAQVLRHVVDEAVLADQVGLACFGVGEHHRADFAISAPEVLLAAIAARTERIHLGSAVTVLSTDDPIRVFQRFSTLNAVSHGRAEVILGRGSFTESFPLFGFDLNHYHVLFEEKLDLFAQLVTNEPVTWSGRTRPPLEAQRVFPPIEHGHLTTWVGVGGSGVLFLMPVIGLKGGFVFVAACIALVTVFIVLPLQEAPTPAAQRRGAGLAAAGREMRHFAEQAFRSFLGTRGAYSGLFFALLPAGAMSLGLALQSNLAVEIGMSDDSVAWLSLWSQVVSAACMVLGGMLSDRYGRRRTLFVYLALMSLPVLYMMAQLTEYQWIMPLAAADKATRVVPPALITAMWIATLTYSVAQGLMYGTRSAIFMDVTNPAVAATQFTAYMAMMNLAISYSATWQGIAIEALGYPNTLLIDALTGLLCLAVLPFIKPAANPLGDGGGAGRARVLAAVLALGCLAFLPFRAGLLVGGLARWLFDTHSGADTLGKLFALGLAAAGMLAATVAGILRLARRPVVTGASR